MSLEILTKFKVNTHGFQFANTFKNHIYWNPGPFDFHFTTSGRCGGMCYSALDYFHGTGNSILPRNTQRPSDGSNLARWIYNRQLKSLENTMQQWVERVVQRARGYEFFSWGYNESKQFGIVKRSLDAGEPIVLGLFPVGWDLLSNPGHQVLAIGYKLPDGPSDFSDFYIYIYDPNFPKDEMVLWPSVSAGRWLQAKKSDLEASIKTGGPLTTKRFWANYFADSNYKPLPPDGIQPDPDGIDYRNQDLDGKDLSGSDLTNAQLNDATFFGADFNRSDLSGSNCNNSIFNEANFTNASLAGVLISNASFAGADMRNATLDNAKCHWRRPCNFVNAKLQGAKLKSVHLPKALMVSALLSGADASGARLRRANLVGANLHRTYCYRTDLTNAALNGSDLRNTIFHETNLTNANLSGSDLHSADFKDAVLTKDARLWKNVKNWHRAINLPPWMISFLSTLR